MCSNEPRRAYDPTSLPALKLQGNKIKNVSKTSQFCSAICVKRSSFYRNECLVNKTDALLEELDPNALTQVSPIPPIEAPSLVIPPPQQLDIKIVEKPEANQSQPIEPKKEQADFEAPSQRGTRPTPRPFILGKTQKLQQPLTIIKTFEDPEEIPDEEHDEDIKGMLAAAMLLREELQAAGEF